MEQKSLDFAIAIKKGIMKKAKKNKKFSTFLFFVVLFSTVISPVLILISENFWISKFTPALLTAGAALSSYWIQLRKPHERWVLYRTAQREIEHEINLFTFKTGNYSCKDAETLLAKNISDRALKLHYDWMPLVPQTKELDSLIK